MNSNKGHGGYQVKFTDTLNQSVLGGKFWTFDAAMACVHNTIGSSRKSSFKIIRVSDGIVLAQSK